jgi:hypothetical protein
MFKYFFWTTLLLILCLGVLIFTLTQLDPLGSQAILALILFFSSLFGATMSVLTYLFFFGAELCVGKNLSIKNFKYSLRRGFLGALFISSTIALRLFNLLGWIELLLSAIFLLLIELIFFVKPATLESK